MPWILKKKKEFVALLAHVFLLTPYWYIAIVIWLLLFLYYLKCLILFYWHSLNNRISNHASHALTTLHDRKEIDKIHTLIIGDTCTKELVNEYKQGNVLCVQFPDRSLEASYHIFMHLESILEENGRVLILHDNRAPKNGISIFDLPYLHFISIKELNMEGWQKKHACPLLYAPIRCIKFLTGVEKKDYQEAPCPLADLPHFCKERNYQLKYLCIN